VTHTITITDTEETFSCRETQHLLAGMMQLGKKGIPVGCRGGGCGVCKIHILCGTYETKKMSRVRITEQEENAGTLLACRVFPKSDIQLQVLGHLNDAVNTTKA
jgi:ferredoxin